jgi:hypothetical protein
MTHVYSQLVKAFASRKTKTTSVALIVAGALMVQAAPPDRLPTAVVGGSLGFSLLFAWLFFHHGLPLLPSKQRGPFTLVVLVVLSSLLVVQTHAMLALASEVLHGQAASGERVTLTDRASSGSR